ncbi:uncharacterized protein K02A2.6-like [Galendromus occidentalis]|uniref:RNA-directed DNA polymerase n=1 Tax=Galendromus occidentalis TaxID=34638 RepID=A0AAJ7L545_9ACAR|nr:uncharacterized protein K02A2.6-like [Galendromus occidentalis]
MRPELLQRTHKSHLGYDSMCRRVKDTIFWPGIRNDIKNMAMICEACQVYRNKQRAEPLVGKPIPTRPWQVIHQDLFSWRDCQYLVTIDSFSDFFEIDRLGRDTTTKSIIEKTAAHLSRYGRPSEIHTDSDPRYLANEFQEFLKSWRIKHITSSPHYHQSNGKSESAVKAAKRIIKKTQLNRENLQEALLEWRSTPQVDGQSPAQKFFSRTLATLMPMREENLRPTNSDLIQKQITARRDKQKRTHDKSAKDLQPIAVGQKVRIQPTDYTHEWKLGTCLQQLRPRTYLIKTPEGGSLIRNRRL